MAVPEAVLTVTVLPLIPVTPSLKVAVMFAVRLTAVAPLAGVRAVTVGAGPVVKVQLSVVNGLPAASRIALEPPVRVAVYLVSAARFAVGSSVATLLVAL